MVDPLSLAAVGGVALAEGIKFLYGQAGELLKRWRDRGSAEGRSPEMPPSQQQVVNIELPAAAFAGNLAPATVNYSVLERLAPDLTSLRKDLSEYATGVESVPTTDPQVLEQIDTLRLALEAILEQRITFAGEHREPSGVRVTGRAVADEVQGRVAGVRAQTIVEGDVSGTAYARRVVPGGELHGVNVDVIGTPPVRPNRTP
jgi:hypothetical protein